MRVLMLTDPVTAQAIVNLAIKLGAAEVGGPLSPKEQLLINDARRGSPAASDDLVAATAKSIRAGGDPLGKLFYQLRAAEERRASGAVYTPDRIIDPMVTWTLGQGAARIVDAGSGSGRYTAAVLRRNSDFPIVAVDLDPIATLMTRAVVAVLHGSSVTVLNADFTRFRLPRIEGVTAFLGNPPYLRHHQIPSASKLWAQKAAAVLDQKVSGLAGLHAYFYLATAILGRPGDVGCFVTSAEWLDVNYGSIIRNLLTGVLGGEEIHIVEPEAMPFDGVATTAAVVQFRVGTPAQSIGFRSVPTLSELTPLVRSASPVARDRLIEASRWSVFIRTRTQVPDGYIELGEIARVHRGAVTGANSTWVARGAVDLPDEVLYASVTKARELFAAGSVLATSDQLRRVIDIPADLDSFDVGDRRRINRFLKLAKENLVHEGYVAKNRKAWWAVGLKAPAPILATYMARRPPAFVRNEVHARHINIAHGVYPRQEMTRDELRVLADCLSSSVVLGQGRTYAGGLTKFEPKEMERLTIPDLDTLMNHDASATSAVDL
jgi:adenine-specific DNA-methyltransferase